MALRTSLVIAGDADGAKKALADTDRAMAATEKEAAALKAAYDRANGAIGELAKAQALATAEINESRSALASGKIGQEQYNKEILETKSALALFQAEHRGAIAELGKANRAFDTAKGAIGQVTQATGAQRAGMQQLTMQLGDMSTMFAMGAKPMQIFASQSGQVIQAVQLMSGGTGKLAAFLGGPWGMAVTGATMVLAPLIAKLFEAGDASEESAHKVDKLTEALARLRSEQGNAADEGAAEVKIARLQEQMLQPIRNARGETPASIAKRTAARNAEIQAEIEGLQQTVRWNEAVRASKDRNTASTKAATSATEKSTTASRRQSGAISEEAKAYKQAHTEATSYFEALQRQNAEYGKTEKQIREMADARAIAAAGADKQLVAEIKLAAAQREANLAKDSEQQGVNWQKARIEPLEEELKLLGMIGPERERAALKLQEEAYKTEALKNGVEDVNQAWEDYYQRQMALIQGRTFLDTELEKTRELQERVDAIVGGLGRMNFGGRIVGDVANVLTSDNPIASMLSMGGIGALAGTLFGGQEPWDKLALDFETTLRNTFKLGGDFSEALGGTLAHVFQGMQVGGAVSSVIGGGRNAQMGSSLGGALGGAAGSAFLAGGVGAIANLGAFAGPVGAIAGAVLGSVLGGLLDTNRTANAVVTGSGYTVGGKDKGNYSAANDLGQAVEQGLGRIADALGGTLGDFMVSIGMRGDQIRVNTDASSLKFNSGAVGFGQDAEGAVMFAIADAIEDGALEGLSAGIKQLITNGGDLEAQLQKALTLKGVMDEAERNRDPMAYDLNALDDWKANLVAIATEAGEGMAAVEEEYARRRQAILDQYGEDAVSTERDIREKQIELLYAQGKIAKATAMAQELQLEGMSELEQAYQKQIWAAAEASRVANSIHEIKLQVLDLTTAELALKIRREDQLRVATEGEQAELQRLYATQDLIAAQQQAGAIAQAQANEQQAIADERARLERQLLEVMGDTVALQGLDREAIRESNRALFDLINTRRAETTAAQEAAAAQQAIADEHDALRRQWLELIGDTASLQQMDLAKLKSDENRALQQQIWDYKASQDAAAAATQRAAEADRNRTGAIQGAENALRQAWASESGALQQAIDKHSAYANDLRAYAGELTGLATSTGSLASLRDKYKRTEYLAGLGNENSIQSFRSDADAYLAEMRRKATSIEDVRSAEAEVARGALSAAGRSSGIADGSRRQFDLLQKQVSELIDLKDKTVSVQEAIDNLKAVAASQIVPDMTAAFDQGFQSIEAVLQKTASSQTVAAKDNYAGLVSVANWLRKIEQTLSEVTDGGAAMRTKFEKPQPVLVSNTDDAPVPTKETT